MSEKRINFKTLQSLVRSVNKDCKASPEDEKLQEKRRALLELRRALNGEEGVANEEELFAYAAILSEAKRELSKKLEAFGLENYALQNLQLADDMDVVVLEVTVVEPEEETVAEEPAEVNGNIIPNEKTEVNGNKG